ncbi:transglycosylase domain-containing protein [Candidatus Microgenomates bacterium]|nr:transglycosylase domain-containing protein [Candidatus Microgenomates bacterium]
MEDPDKKQNITTTKIPLFSRIKNSLSVVNNRKKVAFWSVLTIFFVWLLWGIPLPTNLSSPNIPVSTRLLDRNGKLLYEIYTDTRRSPVELSSLPEYVKTSTIAIEDKDFYKHYGFSFTGIARAAFKIVTRGKVEGGSTLTQQLVKNALLTPERTIRRKAREFFLTIIVEGIYSKDQILEMYLNQIPYGSTAYGIESASELYFGKPAKNLNLAEASLIAGLPQSPTRYSPFGARPELAKERQREVLNQMVKAGYIDQGQADEAFEVELKYSQIEAPVAPHFALWIKDQLVEKYGEKMVEQGGLRVTTTLDLDLQEFAQTAVATEVAKLAQYEVGNGAAIVTHPSTGEILAMVGSKDYFAEDEDGKVNVTLAHRQPGSSIKPLNYALGIADEKITAATTLADIPTCFSVTGQSLYCPVNYDGGYHGLTQIRFALGNSYNIPAVKVLALNSIENFVKFARNMGLTTYQDPDNYGLSLTLGGGEVRPIDMATAFGVLANSGIKQDLVAITKVETWKGKVLEEVDTEEIQLTGERILDTGVTFIISHILHDNNARIQAFGPSSFLNVKGHPEVSVKTGTTNDRRDNWTIGYTKHAVAVVWVGNNDNSSMGASVSGVSGASPIWNKIMGKVLEIAEEGNYSPDDDGHAWPLQPEDVVGANICSNVGGLPSGDTNNPGCPTRFEYFLKNTVPASVGITTQDVQIFKDTGQIANSSALPEQVETQNKSVYIDPTGAIYCMDCPIASASATIRYPLR